MHFDKLNKHLVKNIGKAETNGERQCLYHLHQMTSLLEKISAKPGSSGKKHLGVLRQPAFMLEGLGRLYEKGFDKKRFTTLKYQAKYVEDALGAIDYHQTFEEICAPIPALKDFQEHFLEGYQESVAVFYRGLADKKWIRNGECATGNRLRKSIKGFDWPSEKKQRKKIIKVFAKTITKLQEDVTSGEVDFNRLEEGLHEFRRDVRWLSIYSHALRGQIVLGDEPLKKEWQHYFTDSVLRSDFNRLVIDRRIKKPIVIPRSAFYALSWLIAHLGDLKDKAQLDEALRHAARFLGKPEEEARNLAARHLPERTLSASQAAQAAKTAVDRFINEDQVTAVLAESLAES